MLGSKSTQVLDNVFKKLFLAFALLHLSVVVVSAQTPTPVCYNNFGWYKAADNQSCDSVCSSVGSTCSPQTDAPNCHVTSILNSCPSCQAAPSSSTPLYFTSGHVCLYNSNSSTSCSAQATNANRTCACNIASCIPTPTPSPSPTPSVTPTPQPTLTPTPTPQIYGGEIGQISSGSGIITMNGNFAQSISEIVTIFYFVFIFVLFFIGFKIGGSIYRR